MNIDYSKQLETIRKKEETGKEKIEMRSNELISKKEVSESTKKLIKMMG